MAEHLQEIRSAGFAIAVSSNFDHHLRGILRGFDLSPLINHFFISGEVGYQKPNPQFFDFLLRKAELSHPSELLHVGDDLKNDFEAARAVGANALLFSQASAEGLSNQVPADLLVSSLLAIIK